MVSFLDHTRDTRCVSFVTNVIWTMTSCLNICESSIISVTSVKLMVLQTNIMSEFAHIHFHYIVCFWRVNWIHDYLEIRSAFWLTPVFLSLVTSGLKPAGRIGGVSIKGVHWLFAAFTNHCEITSGRATSCAKRTIATTRSSPMLSAKRSTSRRTVLPCTARIWSEPWLKQPGHLKSTSTSLLDRQVTTCDSEHVVIVCAMVVLWVIW